MAGNAMFKISYGLYVLTAKDGDKDNGCIINTLIQQTDSPKRVSITVNKQNYTHDMIKNSGVFNVSVLTVNTPFEIFKHFGFQSGRTAQKFFKNPNETRSENGVLYLSSCSNAFISGKVCEEIDLGTHTMFIADVTESEVFNDDESLTYSYYHANIKPKPQPQETKKGYRCKIFGYVYEGEELPGNFVCPVCKHGADDFEKI